MRSLQAALCRLANPVAATRTSECPGEDRWLRLAAGIIPKIEVSQLLEHASSCDYCGPLLGEATEDLNPKLSTEEIQLICQLQSSRSNWQRHLAQRLADIAEATETEPRGRSSPWVNTTLPTAQSLTRWVRWSVSAAAMLAFATAVGFWIVGPQLALYSTSQMIARAYTERRPFVLRLAGAHYSVVRQQRGSSDSRLDQSPDLLDAEVQIARHLSRDPKNPNWLHARARAELLESNYQNALDALQEAAAVRPDDLSIKLDLSTAYVARGEITRQPADYKLALNSLTQILNKNSHDTLSLFNRAIVLEHLENYTAAIIDWERYLQIDPEGEWSVEAKQHLANAKHKLNVP